MTTPPPWHAPAHLWGLPYTNWKKRTGYDLHATFGECVYRFLSLPHHAQQNCQMTCVAAGAGIWNPPRIGSYVLSHGAPPQLSATTDLRAMLAKPPPEPDRPRGPGHSTP